MRLQRLALAMAGTGLLAASVVSAPATAGTTDPKPWSDLTKQSNSAKAATEACGISTGYPTAAGSMEAADVIAGRPPQGAPYESFKFVGTRANATWYMARERGGHAVLLLRPAAAGREPVPAHHLRVRRHAAAGRDVQEGRHGWTSFKSIATSNYSIDGPSHAYLYGLNSNGSLYRYSDRQRRRHQVPRLVPRLQGLQDDDGRQRDHDLRHPADDHDRRCPVDGPHPGRGTAQADPQADPLLRLARPTSRWSSRLRHPRRRP